MTDPKNPNPPQTNVSPNPERIYGTKNDDRIQVTGDSAVVTTGAGNDVVEIREQFVEITDYNPNIRLIPRRFDSVDTLNFRPGAPRSSDGTKDVRNLLEDVERGWDHTIGYFHANGNTYLEYRNHRGELISGVKLTGQTLEPHNLRIEGETSGTPFVPRTRWADMEELHPANSPQARQAAMMMEARIAVPNAAGLWSVVGDTHQPDSQALQTARDIVRREGGIDGR